MLWDLVKVPLKQFKLLIVSMLCVTWQKSWSAVFIIIADFSNRFMFLFQT